MKMVGQFLMKNNRHGKQWSESPVSQSAERAGWEYGRTQQKNK